MVSHGRPSWFLHHPLSHPSISTPFFPFSPNHTPPPTPSPLQPTNHQNNIYHPTNSQLTINSQRSYNSPSPTKFFHHTDFSTAKKLFHPSDLSHAPETSSQKKHNDSSSEQDAIETRNYESNEKSKELNGITDDGITDDGITFRRNRSLLKGGRDEWTENSKKHFKHPFLSFEDFISHSHFFYPYLFFYRYSLLNSLHTSKLESPFPTDLSMQVDREMWTKERAAQINSVLTATINQPKAPLSLTNQFFATKIHHFCSPNHNSFTPNHLTPNHLTSNHLTPSHLTPNHLTPNHLTPNHLTPNHLTPNHLTPNHLTPNHLTPNHLTPNHLTPSHLPSLSSTYPSFLPPLSDPSRTPTRFQCEACLKSYSTYNGLFKHKELHCSSLSRRAYTCPHCQNKSYGTLGALKMHIKTHTLPCKCKYCGKAFSRPWLLRGHLRTHTGEKPFRCANCSRAFADKSNLRAHLQTHVSSKKHHCVSCDRTFSRFSLFVKHKTNQGCV